MREEYVYPDPQVLPEDILVSRAVLGLRALMDLCGDNSRRPGLIESPERIIKAYREMTGGLHEDPEQHLKKNFDLEDGGISYSYDQIIISRGIPFASICEHHWLPFTGEAHVAYIPGSHGKVVGLSKLARVVDIYARRPQVQEKLTAQISDSIQRVLDPLGVAVIVKAKHTCQCLRGVKKDGEMVTSSIHGVFRSEPETRAELYELLKV